MAEDRLPCCRSASTPATISDGFRSRSPAMSFRPLQNASSRLMLVLWPAITIERLRIEDFIASAPRYGSANRDGLMVLLTHWFAMVGDGNAQLSLLFLRPG